MARKWNLSSRRKRPTPDGTSTVHRIGSTPLFRPRLPGWSAKKNQQISHTVYPDVIREIQFIPTTGSASEFIGIRNLAQGIAFLGFEVDSVEEGRRGTTTTILEQYSDGSIRHADVRIASTVAGRVYQLIGI